MLRFARKGAFLLFCGMGLASTFISAVSAESRQTTISNCSVAAYDLKLTIRDVQTDKTTAHIVKAGRCDDIAVNLGDQGAIFSLAAVPSTSVSRLLDYSFFIDAWGGHPVFETSGSGVQACVGRMTGEIKDVGWLGRCGSAEKRVELGFLSGAAEQHFLFIEDPFVCAEANKNCGSDDIGELLAWSSALNRALEISWEAQNPTFDHGLIPTETGLATSDLNGPLERGIYVDYRVEPVTPFGSPILGMKGDVILTFNGEPIFDKDSFIILAIKHGMRSGYENPYKMQLLRGGKIYEIEGYTAFHRGTFGSIFLDGNGMCRVGTRAALSSALNEATFYTAPILGCARYDLENISASRRQQCEFAYRQLLAAYRQWCGDVTRYGSIVGAVIMPGRKGAETMLRRFGLKKLGSLAAPMAVEALEETARAVLTLPPGIHAVDNINSIAQQIAFGMAVGQIANQGLRVFSAVKKGY